MKIIDAIKGALRRSKHQTHQRVRTGHGQTWQRGMRAIVNPAGTKLAKRFAKAAVRGPRGY